MAANNGIFNFRGTIGGFTVDRNGVVRQYAGSREIKSERTLENNSEFGTAAKQGKVIRDALHILGGDSKLSGRMLKTVRSGIALDPDHDRGKRILSQREASIVLKGFELNGNVNLGSIAPITSTIVADKLVVSKLGGGNLQARDVYSPTGTTDVQLIGLVATVDITPEVLEVEDITIASALGSSKDELVLQDLEAKAHPTLLTIVAVGIKFFQSVNEQLYELNNGAYSAGRIVAVIPSPTP